MPEKGINQETVSLKNLETIIILLTGVAASPLPRLPFGLARNVRVSQKVPWQKKERLKSETHCLTQETFFRFSLKKSWHASCLYKLMLALRLNNNNVGNLFDEWDSLFSRGDNSFWRRSDVNYKENDDNYEYWVPLAGFSKEHINARVADGVVSITAKKDESSASYSFILPDGCDPSTISSKMENGLLSVKVDKEKKAKSIELEIT